MGATIKIEPNLATETRSGQAPESRRLNRANQRLLLGALVVGIPLLLLSVDTGLHLLGGWRPAAGFDRRVTMLVGFACLVWGAALALPLVRRVVARRWPVLVLSTAMALLTWSALEMAIPSVPFHLRLPGQREVFRPDPRYVPGVSGDGVLQINGLGIRGDPLPPREAAYRILCVGGSTTECLYLDDRETWTHLLQERLTKAWGRPVWVGNVGISGYATTEHLAFLERFGPLEDMDCVVVMAGFNDLVLSTLGARPPIRRPWEVPVWARSDLFRLIRAGVQESQRVGAPFQDPSGEWIEERRQLRRPASKIDTLPELTSGLEGFEARLVAITELCVRRGVRTVLSTQAVLWRHDLEPAGETLLWTGWTRDRSAFYTAGALRAGMEAFNRRVASVAARRTLELVDVAPLSGELSSFYDDCHFTEAGARRVAELMSNQLALQR